MQLLDLLQSQLSKLPKELQITLQDIVNQVKIESYHCIKHPNYQTIELPESVISRFHNLPVETQKKHLILQLRNFLYSTYYNGSLKPTLTSDIDEISLINNNFLGVDLKFYERLHTSNQSEGYWSHDWLVVKEETDKTLAVNKNGLMVHIERDLYLSPAEKAATIGNFVAIKMPKNLVQNGFYMAVANVGSQSNHDIIRIYFNLTPEGAIIVMKDLTYQLNSIPISFSFKALYNSSDYERYDSTVLYFNKHKYDIVYPILKKIYAENKIHFDEQIPLFTKFLAPGLACAEEPDKKFGDKESFGTHRCQILANGLVTAWEKGDNSCEGRMASILQQFSLHKIELQRPYLNPNSEDIYTCL